MLRILSEVKGVVWVMAHKKALPGQGFNFSLSLWAEGSPVIWSCHHDHITVLFSQLFHLVNYIQASYFPGLMPDDFFCQTQV